MFERKNLLMLVMLTLAFVSGCGQNGALYQPGAPANNTVNNDAEKDKATADKKAEAAKEKSTTQE